MGNSIGEGLKRLSAKMKKRDTTGLDCFGVISGKR